jgi:HNH endonuclease
MVKVHRLVAEAFIPNPENKPEVNHINGIKDCNEAWNLEWVTTAENITHAINIGLRSQKGEQNHESKLSNIDVLEIYNSNEDYITLSKRYNIGRLQISRIKIGYNWSSVTGHKYRAQKRTLIDKDIVLSIFNESGEARDIGLKYGVPEYIVAMLKKGKLIGK